MDPCVFKVIATLNKVAYLLTMFSAQNFSINVINPVGVKRMSVNVDSTASVVHQHPSKPF